MSARNSPLLPIFLIVLVDVLGLTIIFPLLPFYAEKFGASPTVVGLLATSYAFCQLISGPFLGQISDRVGRRPLLLISQVGTFIGFLVLAFANSLWMVFLSRILDGATAGNLTLAQAYISDVTEPQDRSKAFGLIGISFGLGFLIGPAVSGFLSQYGMHVPILAAAALSLTSILFTYFLLPGGVPPREAGAQASDGRRLGVLSWSAYRPYFRDPVLARLLIQFFIFCFTFTLFVSGFALFAERRFFHDGRPFGPKEVGYLFAYSGLLGIVIQGGLLGRLVKRFGESALILASFICLVVGYFVLGGSHSLFALLIATTVASFGNGVVRPCLTGLVSRSVGPSQQGTILGLTQSLQSLAQIVAPIVGGLLIDHGLLSQWAWCAGLIAALALVFQPKRREVEQPDPRTEGETIYAPDNLARRTQPG